MFALQTDCLPADQSPLKCDWLMLLRLQTETTVCLISKSCPLPTDSAFLLLHSVKALKTCHLMKLLHITRRTSMNQEVLYVYLIQHAYTKLQAVLQSITESSWQH